MRSGRTRPENLRVKFEDASKLYIKLNNKFSTQRYRSPPPPNGYDQDYFAALTEDFIGNTLNRHCSSLDGDLGTSQFDRNSTRADNFENHGD